MEQPEYERRRGPAYPVLPEPVTARDVLTPLFFFKRRALIAFILPILVALVAAALAPKVYVADTRLLILLGDDYTAHSALGSTQPGPSFDRTQIVKAETEIIGSRELAEQTVEAIGVHRLYPKSNGRTTVAAAAEQFQKDLSIDNIPQSNVVELSLKNGDPVVAADALNQLVRIYLDRRPQIFEQINQASVDRQASAINARLADAERRIAKFAADHGFGDYQLELTAVTTLQGQLKAQVDELNRQWADRQGQWSQLEQQKAATPQRTELTSDYSRPPALEALEQTLSGLQNQRRDAAQVYVDGSPQVRDLDERIARVQAQIASSQKQQLSGGRQGLNPLWQDVNIRLSVSSADLAGLAKARQAGEAQLEDVNRRLNDLVSIGPQYRDMTRERDLLETTATDLAKQDQATRVRDTLSRADANVRVLQAAQPPLHAKSQRVLILIGGLVVGLVDAAAVVVFSVAIFQGMLTPHDVEQKLAIPVVLTFNQDPDAASVRRGRAPLSPTLMRVDDARVLAHLLRSINPEAPNSVQLIGPDDGVGVTSLIVDLGLLTETETRKVLIIDTEPLPGRSVADLIKRRGGSLAIDGSMGRIARVSNTNLFVTQLRRDSSTEMSEDRWRQALSDMSKRFDLVLIDSPPVTRSQLGLLATPCVDLTIAVLEAEHSHTASARNMIERIAGVGGVVTAAIFNKRRFYIPRALYQSL